MINKIYDCTDEQFIHLIKNSSNISEVLFKLGYSVKGNSWGFSQVKKRMVDLNLSFSDFKGKSPMMNLTIKKQIKPEDLLRKNCKHQRTVLRKHILQNNLLEYRCAICGIKEWNGKMLSLELDHINGINDDNRLENLRFLCPNCHSQTSTYGSRNQQKNESKYDITDELIKLVSDTYDVYRNIKTVSSKLGIRRKVVTQIVNLTGKKRSNQKYVIRYDKDHNEIKRYGSLVEAAKDLIANKEVKTSRVKTCTRTIMYNKNNFWLNSYWTIMDGSGIIDNPLLESSLIDSEDRNIDEAQVNFDSVTD